MHSRKKIIDEYSDIPNVNRRFQLRHPYRTKTQEQKEQIKQASKKYRRTEKGKKANHDYYKNHKEKLLNKPRELRNEIINLLGGRCANPKCPIPPENMDFRALQIDHVNGGGYQHSKKFNNNVLAQYKAIIAEIKVGSKEYQCLCAYCNWLKDRT